MRQLSSPTKYTPSSAPFEALDMMPNGNSQVRVSANPGVGANRISVIEDLKGALGLLSSYTTANHTTQTPAINDGLTKLTATLQDICNDLKCIRALIPLGPHIGASAKMRWTLRRKEIDSKLRDIESRKTTLLVTLEFLSM